MSVLFLFSTFICSALVLVRSLLSRTVRNPVPRFPSPWYRSHPIPEERCLRVTMCFESDNETHRVSKSQNRIARKKAIKTKIFFLLRSSTQHNIQDHTRSEHTRSNVDSRFAILFIQRWVRSPLILSTYDYDIGSFVSCTFLSLKN